jgi:hypothetical protein
MAGGEAQHPGEDELGDEFFLVLAQRLQFERMVGAQRPFHQVDHRHHFVAGQAGATAPQIGQDRIVQVADELAARYSAHESLRRRMGQGARRPARRGSEGRLGRPLAALESEFSMVFARAFAYMD